MANEIYNTSWWGTALDTARTAGTNPDFFGSQMKLLTDEQDNLVVNGDFAVDDNWSKGTGWTISGGKANGSNTTGDLYQENVVKIGRHYKVTYTISNYVSGSVRVELSNNAYAGIERSANGTYTETILSGSTTVLFDARTSFTGSIDNVSVQLVRCELEDIEAKKCLADWIHTTALKDLNN